jgi:hypothetical protein
MTLMTKLVVDPTLRTKLENVESELELCDESGRTLGYFVPATQNLRELYDWAKTQITDEELERRKNEPGGRTTAEVLARLGKE